MGYSIELKECLYTPLGVCVIPTIHSVDAHFLESVDAKILEAEECLEQAYPRYMRSEKKKPCYTVYLPPDVRKSCRDEEQELFSEAPWEGCAAKGLEPIEGCKCGWRVLVITKSWGNVIITTPNLRMLKAGVIEQLSGWHPYQIWEDVKMAGCAGTGNSSI